MEQSNASLQRGRHRCGLQRVNSIFLDLASKIVMLLDCGIDDLLQVVEG
jgi:hypothetical protein